MRWFLANTVIRKFRRLGICGRIRFQMTRWGYRLLWRTAPRIGEWDFVLQYLPSLEKWQKRPTVIDFGCAESLLIYELFGRGYTVIGVDQRDYQEPLPPGIGFEKYDILSDNIFTLQTDYIVSVSTIEHVGLGAYGDKIAQHGDRIAIEKLWFWLKDNGKLILTVPNQWWANKEGRGYTFERFLHLIDGLFRVYELTERSGQICTVLIKIKS